MKVIYLWTVRTDEGYLSLTVRTDEGYYLLTVRTDEGYLSFDYSY